MPEYKPAASSEFLTRWLSNEPYRRYTKPPPHRPVFVSPPSRADGSAEAPIELDDDGGKARVPAAAVTFGHAQRKDWFFAEGFTQFNHGGSGGVPRKVMVAADQYRVLHESDARNGPLLKQKKEAARVAMARVMNADPEGVAFIENASGGFNAVLQRLIAGDTIIDLSTAYSPFVEYYQWLTEARGIRIVTAKVSWPLAGPDEVVSAFERALDAAGSLTNNSLAIFCHVTSHPALVLPVKRLVDTARARGLRTLVDGAHALGQVAVDMNALGDPDYYITDIQKWFYGAKGTALIYARHTERAPAGGLWPQPNTIDSFGDSFQARFGYTGTRDDAPYVAVGAALAYRESLGGEANIRDYIHELALWGQRHLVRAWNSSAVAPESMVGGMVNVIVPTQDASSVDECLAATCGLLSRWGILVNVEPPGTYDQHACVIRMCAQVGRPFLRPICQPSCAAVDPPPGPNPLLRGPAPWAQSLLTSDITL